MATKPSNQTSSSPSLPSKKELSSIVSNLLAEQQKLSKRIEALEKNVVSHSAQPPAAPPPLLVREIKLNVTEEDINEGVKNVIKNHGLRLSEQTIELITPRVTDIFTKMFKGITDRHEEVLRLMWERHEVTSRTLKDIEQRLKNLETAEEERAKREEEARVKMEERARKWKSLRLNPIVNSVTSSVKHACKYIANHLHSFYHTAVLDKSLFGALPAILFLSGLLVFVVYGLVSIVTWLFPNIIYK